MDLALVAGHDGGDVILDSCLEDFWSHELALVVKEVPRCCL